MPFLKLGVGSRPVAMGEAFTAISDDANAMFWNPAGMGMMKSFELSGMIMNLYDNVVYGSGAVVFPVVRKGSISAGLAGAYLSATDTLRDENGTSHGAFTIWDALGSAGVGWQVKSYLSLGATGKFVASKIHTYHAYSVLGDFGVKVNPTKYLYFGLKLENVGTPRSFISDLEFPPTTARGGLAMIFPFNKSHLILSSDLIWPIDRAPSLAIGGELKIYIKPEQLAGSSGIILRAGYRSGYHLGTWGGTSFGLGYEYELTPLVHISIDAVYFSYGFLGNSDRLSLGVNFRPS
jgi:hypothetical protein